MNAKSIKDNIPLILVWSCIVLLPFGRSVELPVAIMAMWIIWLIRSQGRSIWWVGGARVFTLVFVLFWLPACISALDAVNVQKTVKTVLTLPRLYLAGLFVIHVLSDRVTWEKFLAWSAWVLLFWLVDALIQAVTGHDILGYNLIPQRLNGVFGSDVKFGVVAPVLFGLLFEYARSHWGRRIQVTLFVAATVVVFLAGSRAGWVMFSVLVLAYVMRLSAKAGRSPTRLLVAAFVLAVAVLSMAYQVSEGFKLRVDTTLLIFSGNEADLDRALSKRLPIWRTAVKMFAEHPINGVGARGFRYDYPEHAEPGDPFLDSVGGVGAFHAHQLILDVLTETGLIGMAGFLSAMLVLIRSWRLALESQRRWMFPGGVAVLVALFPINTHLAIYSSFWSQMVWFVVALYCAGMTVQGEPVRISSG